MEDKKFYKNSIFFSLNVYLSNFLKNFFSHFLKILKMLSNTIHFKKIQDFPHLKRICQVFQKIFFHIFHIFSITKFFKKFKFFQ